MSLEGTGGAWDIGPEVRGAREVPYAEGGAPQPRVLGQINPEDFSSVENAKGYESAAEIIRTEGTQAGALIDFVQDAIRATGEDVNAPGLLEEDGKKIKVLGADLEVALANTSLRYTEEDKVNALKFGHTIVPEETTTIAGDEKAYDGEVTLGRVKIPVQSEQEGALLRKAAGGVGIPRLGELSEAEISEMTHTIEAIAARDLPGDEWYNMATDILRRQAEYDAVQRPFRVENGMRNVTTGETAAIEVIASPREKFAVENPNLSLRDKGDLERGLREDNPRARLEELLLKLRSYTNRDRSHPASSSGEVIGGLSETPPEGNKPASDVVGGLSVDSTISERPDGTAEQAENDLNPESLLELSGMPIDKFFSLDREAVYGVLRHTQVLTDDNPARIKAMRILDLLEKGRDSYLEMNPGSETITF